MCETQAQERMCETQSGAETGTHTHRHKGMERDTVRERKTDTVRFETRS